MNIPGLTPADKLGATIVLWRRSLSHLLHLYEEYRKKTPLFFLQLFLFFVIVNISCYWWAMYTAFPILLQGHQYGYYFKIQFPVGLLGAVFDSFSFFATIYIIRQALKARSARSYVAHLTIDFLIALLATAWVLFVFSISGWIISFTEPVQQTLSNRAETYEKIVVAALEEPIDNIRNIYFGIIMGLSAMIPTTTHIVMSFRAFVKSKG